VNRLNLTRREFLRRAAGLAAGAAALGCASRLGHRAEPETVPSSPALPQRVLGKTGVQVSILGLGGAGFLTDLQDQDAIGALLTEALDGGITYLDTAYRYGDGRSEQNLGLVTGTGRRQGVFLATKTEDRTYDGALRQVETSLKRLKTDRLDLIQVHHLTDQDDLPALLGKAGVVPALEKLRDQNIVRFIGMTGHPEYQIVREALAAYDWDTFLGFVNPHPDARVALAEQIPLARKKGMGIIGMKVFGGSTPAVLVGDGPGKAPARLLLRYALSQPIATAIPAISTREHLRENLEVARSFAPMPAAEMAELERRLR